MECQDDICYYSPPLNWVCSHHLIIFSKRSFNVERMFSHKTWIERIKLFSPTDVNYIIIHVIIGWRWGGSHLVHKSEHWKDFQQMMRAVRLDDFALLVKVNILGWLPFVKDTHVSSLFYLANTTSSSLCVLFIFYLLYLNLENKKTFFRHGDEM